MRILFDQGTPAPLRRFLVGHEVVTAYERGWASFKNGALLEAAEKSGFSVFVTTDANLKYQQNLDARCIAIVVMSTTSWPRIRSCVGEVVRVVEAAVPGSYAEVRVP